MNPCCNTALCGCDTRHDAGRLIGEYSYQAAALQETVYLGDIPVAVIKGADIYYLHADHLNTPRVITDTANNVVWSWQSDAFGNTQAVENTGLDDLFIRDAQL